MRGKSFLNSKTKLYFSLCLGLLLILGQFVLFLIGLLLYGILAWLFRVGGVRPIDYSSVSPNIVLSPTSGLVKQVVKNAQGLFYEEGETILAIHSLVGMPISILMPFDGEVVQEKKVDHLFGPGLLESFLPVKKKRENRHENIRAYVIRCDAGGEIGLLPSDRDAFYLSQGDRAVRGSVIGHVPFGGNILLYVPSNYEVLVEEGAMISAGSSKIVAMR